MTLLLIHRFASNCVLGLGKNRLTIKQILLPSSVRCLCSKPMKKEISQHTVESSRNIVWTPIYHFPFIRIARLVNRLKLYQSFFTVVVLPLFIGLYCYDATDLTSVLVISGSAIFTCFSLYITTSFFKRLIGVIFLSEDKKNVKISHLTFWGNRKDIVVAVEDIIPLTDGTCKATDAFVKLYRCNTDEVLYLTLRFGKFLDRDSFQNIFGSFEILRLK